MQFPVVIAGNPRWKWLDFTKYRSRKWFAGFAYDSVTDDEITFAINKGPQADLTKSWKHFWKGSNRKTKEWHAFHSDRIAALIVKMRAGGAIRPVAVHITHGQLVRLFVDQISYVEDGHHRLRALSYLKYSVFPAYTRGVKAEIEAVLYQEAT